MTNYKACAIGVFAALIITFGTSCGNSSASNSDGVSDTTRPTLTSKSPADKAVDVPVNQPVTAIFSEPMNEKLFTVSTFTLTEGASTLVPGTVTCVNTVATFAPTANLAPRKVFTARIAMQVADKAGNSMVADAIWTFTTGEARARGPVRVILGNSGDFVILAKSKVSTTGETTVVGDIGLSPAEGSQFNGFALTMDESGNFAKSPSVTGSLYAAGNSQATKAKVATAVRDMEAAFTEVSGRKAPDATDLGDGAVNRITIAPGIYTWSDDLSVPNGITLEGGPHDVWVFQIAGDLIVGDGAKIAMAGGALAANVFWQVKGKATLGTNCEFSGVVLARGDIDLLKGAVVNGRLLSQSSVNLDAAKVSAP